MINSNDKRITVIQSSINIQIQYQIQYNPVLVTKFFTKCGIFTWEIHVGYPLVN